MDKEKTLMQFTELNEVELDAVVGESSFWDEVFRRFKNNRVSPKTHIMT